MSDLYDRAVGWAGGAGGRPASEREAAHLGFERESLDRCRVEPARAPHAALCARVPRYHAQFFTFVIEPGMPPTNNAAEWALRPWVIARKVSGGMRSARGSRMRMRLQSLIHLETWRPGPLRQVARPDPGTRHHPARSPLPLNS